MASTSALAGGVGKYIGGHPAAEGTPFRDGESSWMAGLILFCWDGFGVFGFGFLVFFFALSVSLASCLTKSLLI
ncbi:hypothetical protein HanPI659440_Chr13g0496701 [Helianthus annuus]|nr:hypothetical protein HanPI659440_Chr13g0496701 [Helianthus annuus]